MKLRKDLKLWIRVRNVIFDDTVEFYALKRKVYNRCSMTEYYQEKANILGLYIDTDARYEVSQEEFEDRCRIIGIPYTEEDLIKETMEKRTSENGECLAYPFGFVYYDFDQSTSVEDLDYMYSILERYQLEEESIRNERREE